MKTNQIMKRPMGQFEVLQRASDGYFDATNFHGEVDVSEFIKVFYTSTEIPIKIEDSHVWYDENLFVYVTNKLSPKVEFINQEYKTMTFDEALRSIGIDSILNTFGLLIKSFPTEEKMFFTTIGQALSSLNNNNIKFYREYSINNGQFRIDMLVKIKHHWNNGVTYTIIEYDEKYHSHNKQFKKDLKREKSIFNALKKEGLSESDEVNIDIVRIKEGQEGLAYLYLIPFISGIETSYSCDKLHEHLDYRIVLSNELGIDLTIDSKNICE